MFESPTETLSPDARRVFDRAISCFTRLVGVPRWAAVAPGRVNLIGEHVDYNDGFVLPIAIDRTCVAIGSPALDARKCRVHALDKDESSLIDMTKTPPVSLNRGSWLSYIAGVIAMYQRELGVARISPMDIAVASSVPLGGGLSSSASLELAIATLIEQAASIEPDPRRKALLCQRAEHEFAGVPCGIMDQFISAMGERDSALLIDCASAQGHTIPMPGQEHAVVMVINTNVRHELSSGEYASRRATCERAIRTLGVGRWRDATLDILEISANRLDEEERRCARHVITEIARTLDAATALRSGLVGLPQFGRLMDQSHASLRDDYRVSCSELDAVVEIARAVPGVFGARMTGGGFGGCVIALVRPDAVEALTNAVIEQYRELFGRTPTVFTTTASPGARSIRLSRSKL